MWGWVDGDGDECATDDQKRPPCLPARRRVERGTLPARLGAAHAFCNVTASNYNLLSRLATTMLKGRAFSEEFDTDTCGERERVHDELIFTSRNAALSYPLLGHG